MRGSIEHIARLALGGKIEAGRYTIEYPKAARLFGAFDRILKLSTAVLKELGEPVTPAPYVVSIPGCATRFARRVTNAHGGCHLHAENADFAFEHEAVVVVPLRHPRRVWESWCARDRGRTLLEPFGWFWSALQTYAGLYEIHWLPVDHPGYRDEYFGKICTAMGIDPPDVDWSVRDGHDDPNRREIPVPDYDLTEIMTYPCVRQFYDREPPE